jgi:hypothetical protein
LEKISALVGAAGELHPRFLAGALPHVVLHYFLFDWAILDTACFTLWEGLGGKIRESWEWGKSWKRMGRCQTVRQEINQLLEVGGAPCGHFGFDFFVP